MKPVPQYKCGKEIARGGMGAVLTAEDLRLGRTVAMKVMLTQQADPSEAERFHQEARVLGRLAHPNIVPIHDVGVDAGGRHFYTMKLVEGTTLHDILRRVSEEDPEALEKYSLSNLLTIFQKVCDAIAFAHSRGIIHRDLKPQNIMVGAFGEVLVMDWGLAKIISAEDFGTLPEEPKIDSSDASAPTVVDGGGGIR
ncbi:MAG: serine/threonine-protein kinase [Limisphaerales bacterium]